MAEYVIAPTPQPALPVRGSTALFPVRRIFCVGRNYAGHAREMGAKVDKSAGPMFFTKSSHALAQSGSRLPYPPATDDYHFEMELVVALAAPAFRIAPEAAQGVVFGYACGLDMTRRDLQNKAKAQGHPWDLAKSADQSAIVGEIVPVAECGVIERGEIALRVDGELRQQADLSEMIWNVAEVIADLSQYFHLQPGDLIFTGTPEGVGPVKPGSRLSGSIAGVGVITAEFGPAA
jgi:fumarylpyruvate hydrolase